LDVLFDLVCAGAWNDGYDGSADAVVELGSSMKLVA
jgi:hypothetical protein